MHTAEQPKSALACDLRGAGTSRSFFAVIPGESVGHAGLRQVPDSVRLALPRPPNLECEYQSTRKWCQEKIAKSGEEISRTSISSGGVSWKSDFQNGADLPSQYGSTLKSELLRHFSREARGVTLVERSRPPEGWTRASRTLSNSGNAGNRGKQPRGARI